MRITSLICSLLLMIPAVIDPAPVQASAYRNVSVGVAITIAPPILPIYEQPLCPGPGYIWTPGYWAYGDDGYYWVPGTWVFPPEVGLLWTPGYWSWVGGVYVWNVGYWGPVVGFYGGINYGFGYPGVGFFGGYWRGGEYFYNRSVTNVNTTIVHNVYNRTVINNTSSGRVSFNGGAGGTHARASSAEMVAARGRHIPMTSAQIHHQEAAGSNRTLLASVNHGRPDIAATPRPGQFNMNNRGAISTTRPSNGNRPPERMAEPNRPGTGTSHSSRPPERMTNSNRPPERMAEPNRPSTGTSHSSRPAERMTSPNRPTGNSHSTVQPPMNRNDRAPASIDRHPAETNSTHPSTVRPQQNRPPSQPRATAPSRPAAPHTSQAAPSRPSRPSAPPPRQSAPRPASSAPSHSAGAPSHQPSANHPQPGHESH